MEMKQKKILVSIKIVIRPSCGLKVLGLNFSSLIFLYFTKIDEEFSISHYNIILYQKFKPISIDFLPFSMFFMSKPKESLDLLRHIVWK